MDRLTARDGFGTPYYPYCDNVKGCGGYCAQCNFETKTMDKLAQYEDLEDLIGIPMKDLAEILRQNIPEDCKHPHKAIVLTDDDVDKWQDYKNAEEQGLLLRLPVKVGDTVYYISDGFIELCTVEVIFLADYTDKDGNISYMAEIHFDREDCPYVSSEIYFTDIGKTVFLTRVEAEQKLKEMENNYE